MVLESSKFDSTVDYSWFRFIAYPLFKLLEFVNNYTNNWGVSIILVTIFIRILIYPLSRIQYFSMIKMRMLQPQLDDIRKSTYDSKIKNEKIIALYKKAKVNPLSSFFSLIIQMPVFFSFYYVLSHSIELRHAPFILWIYDLSDKDNYFILPIIMGITMFFVQKTSFNNIIDSFQQKIIFLIPIICTMFFLYLPSGLVLYYITNNIITIYQQWYIGYNLENYEFYLNK